jgi:hypothetical protein
LRYRVLGDVFYVSWINTGGTTGDLNPIVLCVNAGADFFEHDIVPFEGIIHEVVRSIRLVSTDGLDFFVKSGGHGVELWAFLFSLPIHYPNAAPAAWPKVFGFVFIACAFCE